MRKKEIAFILISILFAAISSFLIYNLRVILVYLVDINIGPFKQPNIARYICYFLFSYFIRLGNISLKRKFLYIAIPAILLDSTTIFFGPELIPLRFPYLTIYPIFGIICGLLLQHSSRRFIHTFIGTAMFFIISEIYIIPEILWLMYKSDSNEISISKNEIAMETFKGVNSKQIKLKDTIQNKVALLEFYFVGCPPCEDKYEYLKKLVDEYQDKGLEIVLICDGSASTYEQFIAHWKKNSYKNIIFLYAQEKSLSKYNIEGFPTEFLYAKGKVQYREKGFGKAIATKWFEGERKKIQTLLDNISK